MKIVDVTSCNGESELLDLRHEILKDYVDEFIVVQAPTTFTGKPKPIYPVPDWATSYVIDENYTPEEIELAENSPNTKGAEHWKHEFLQKESIKKALTHLDDKDVVFVGDTDEVWSQDALNLVGIHKLKLRVYTYYLNNKSSEVFWGTLKAPYSIIKDSCLNHLRTVADKTRDYYGWHFTSMYDLRKKLDDQYTEESYNTDWVRENLAENIKNRKDFLGRDFKMEIDESQWPVYLQEHREKYEHLLWKN